MNLLEVPNGGVAIIEKIPHGEAGQRLEAMGLRESKKIKRISGMPFCGPITVLLDGRYFAIAHGIASKVQVKDIVQKRVVNEL
ncbi:MAG: ferrous iron transport protein A [Synergistaceae bacterium]|nr:ferrous iron transport protein A [Synergistaceae bacterium]